MHKDTIRKVQRFGRFPKACAFGTGQFRMWVAKRSLAISAKRLAAKHGTMATQAGNNGNGDLRPPRPAKVGQAFGADDDDMGI